MDEGDNEKRRAALSSVTAAVFLTGLKLVVGLMTGSLGILAEAAHSGLDLAAALVTYFAVRLSGKPADGQHQYGHGKVENLAAMFETLLLLITCVWIITEAYDRLAHRFVHVDASIWAFGIMIVSIVVDFSRSRMLYRVARKHRSQALEADALHFSTDIWSSAVVLIGLLGVKLSDWVPALVPLKNADAIAALVVAIVVIYVSIQLGNRTMAALIDTAPAGMAEKIKARVEAIESVMDCHAIRVRASGPQWFVDVHVSMDGAQSLAAAHELTERIERAIQEVLPGADVTVHPEPRPATTPATEQPSQKKAS